MIQDRPTQTQADFKNIKPPQLLTSVQLPIMPSNLQLALNNTFLTMRSNQDEYVASQLVHVDENGQILDILKLDCYMEYWTLVSESEVLYVAQNWQTGVYQIAVWDLITKKTANLWHPRGERASRTEYVYFFDSRILCKVLKFKDKQSSKIMLKYYSIAASKNPALVYSYTYDLQDIDQIKVKKINNRNLLTFLPLKYQVEEEKMCFDAYRFDYEDQKVKAELLNFKINHNFTNLKDVRFFIRISDIWEIEIDKFYVQVEVSVDIYNLHKSRGADIQKILLEQIRQKEVYHNFYWNSKENCRSSMGFNIPTPHRVQFIQNIRNFQAQEMSEKEYWAPSKKLSKINSRHRSERQAFKPIPVYYFNSLTQQVMAVHRVPAKSDPHRFNWPQFKSSSPAKLIEYSIENNSQTILQIKKIPEPYEQRVLYASLMLKVVQDCNEDLLHDTINLLD